MELIAHDIKVLDTTIHYYTCGKGSPLIFIHGHRADALRYKGVITYLARFYKVYAPDLPGFGGSPPLLEWHSMENLAKYTDGFIEKLNLSNITLAGFSMGSVIAIHTALLTKAEISQLALFGTPFDKKFFKMSLLKREFLTKFSACAAKSRVFLFLANHFQKSNKLMFFSMKNKLPKDKRTKDILDYEIHCWRSMPMRVWLESISSALQTNFTEKNFIIEIPTLLVETPNDHLLQVNKNLAALKKHFPNHKVIMLPLDRHVPYGDFDEKFIAKLAPEFKGFLPVEQ